MKNKNYCVILAGGVGSRLWPLSRKGLPKQFIDFFGTGRTLLQQTYDRCCRIVSPDHIFIVTNNAYTGLVHEQLPEIDMGRVLSEPSRRNTAPCVAWAACHIYSIESQANIVIVPSDQLILKEKDFVDAMCKGFRFVSDYRRLLCVGMRPVRPETRYGYIQVGDDGDDGFYQVKTFTEKPERELAEVFVESGEFYWNAGIFLGNVEVIVEAFKSCVPELAARFDFEHNEGVYGADREEEFIREQYQFCPNISVEYGILEKSDNVYVMPCDFGWSDLGTWSTYYDALVEDDEGNVVLADEHFIYNSRACMVLTKNSDKTVVMEGLDNFLVVDTEDVLLICPKDDAGLLRKYMNDIYVKSGNKYM